jgi:hypothetical protein
MSNDLVTIGDFPIFDEDEKYGVEELEEIVRVNNARIADTGDCIPVVLGHTRDDADEVEQPPIVGWADSLRLSLIGEVHPRYAITATFRILKECVDLVKKFPRRSVELWTQDKVIDPIALLSTSRPAKNLGLMTFSQSRSGSKMIKFFEQGANMQDQVIADKDTLVKLIVTTLEQSEIGQYVKAQMAQPEPVVSAEETVQEEGKEEAALDEQLESEKRDELLTEDTPQDQVEGEEDPQEDVKDETKDEVKDEEKPVKHEMVEVMEDEDEDEDEEEEEDEEDDPRLKGLKIEGEEHPEFTTEQLLQLVDDHLAEDPEYYVKKCEEVSPGGSNTFIPDDKISYSASGMSLGQLEDVVERYKREQVELHSELGALRSQLRMLSREKELFKLNAQFAFDLAEELELVRDFNDSQFVKHCEVIKSRYAEYPVNRGVGVVPVQTEEGVKPPMTAEKMNRAIDLATRTKCSFEEALKQVCAGA